MLDSHNYYSLSLMTATGCLSLKKVKFATRQEHEYISNYKIAQNSFKKVGVDKVCDKVLE